MLYNVNDRYIGRSLALYGEWKEHEVRLFSRLLRPGHLVLDVGANIGPHTVFFARAVGAEGAVLAFEPQRLFFQALCANVALNSLPRCYCHPMAVGDHRGQIEVPVRSPWLKDFNFSALPLQGVKYTDCEIVELTTLDSFHLARCDFIKVEVVGMEYEVLKGAEQTLRNLRPILYVENDVLGTVDASSVNQVMADNQARSDRLVRYIASLGYELYWHVAPYFHADNFSGNRENVFGRLAARNMLCVPAGRGHSITALPRVDIPA